MMERRKNRRIKPKGKIKNKEAWREFEGVLKGGPKDLSMRINDIYDKDWH